MPVVDEALARAGRTLDDVDLIAVTSGPGPGGALLVGVQVAKSLAWPWASRSWASTTWRATCWPSGSWRTLPEPPFLGLVVSGGHTSLYEVQDYGRYRLVGRTRDDAAGEAFDKSGASILGLPYPDTANRSAGAEGEPGGHPLSAGVAASGHV